jgi:hypothetical protein
MRLKNELRVFREEGTEEYTRNPRTHCLTHESLLTEMSYYFNTGNPQ